MAIFSETILSAQENLHSKNQEAIALAATHYLIEEGVSKIFRIVSSEEIESNPSEPIKLLEVNEATVPAGIMPIRFGPSLGQGRHYSCVIVEITPDEFEQFQSEKLKLPEGWNLGELLPRPADEGS